MSCLLPDVYGVKYRHARKEHKCCECNGLISKGEWYFYHHGVWDSQGRSFKVCSDCEQLRQEINKYHEHWEDYSPFGELSEDVFGMQDIFFGCWYINTKIKRGADIPAWMLEQLSEWGW